jgi:hypothetical protein
VPYSSCSRSEDAGKDPRSPPRSGRILDGIAAEGRLFCFGFHSHRTVESVDESREVVHMKALTSLFGKTHDAMGAEPSNTSGMATVSLTASSIESGTFPVRPSA